MTVLPLLVQALIGWQQAFAATSLVALVLRLAST